MTIYGNYPDDILISTAQNKPNRKFSGWVYLMRNGQIHRPIVNTEFVYDSEEQAKKAMTDLCDWCVKRYTGDTTPAEK